MTRFNSPKKIRIGTPIVSTPDLSVLTGNSAPGFTRDARGELFLLAVANFVGQDAHYETGVARDARFKKLIHEVATTDAQWLARFLPWLRNEANMRTASIVGAVEAAVKLAAMGGPGASLWRGKTSPRQIVDSVLMRPDEPAEALAYAKSVVGRVPKPVKRGIADATARIYGEYGVLKYDTASHGMRFGDVAELVHPKPTQPGQSTLFKHLIDRRHGREGIPSSLTMMHANAKLREQVAMGRYQGLLRDDVLREAGMTWEDALSLAGDKVPKGKLWDALIPNMGYMALLRNLRNFDEAGIVSDSAELVAAKLSHPYQVQRSRQLPMRFLSAYRAVRNVRWHYPLEVALGHSLNNIPQFAGRTLILIDTSGSMNCEFSAHKGRKPGAQDYEALKFWDAAAMFGLALAQRCETPSVVSFSHHSKVFPAAKGSSLLLLLEEFKDGYYYGGGTQTYSALRQHYNQHDRVIILTDEQADHHPGRDVADMIPDTVPVITFNLAGYKVGHMESGSATRVTIGGLSDAAFKLLPALDARARGGWPF